MSIETGGIIRIPYDYKTFDLSVARTREKILDNGAWDFILVSRMVAESPVYLHLNHSDAPPVPLREGMPIKCPPEFLREEGYEQPPIRRLYLTNSAEEGGVLELIFGGDASFEVGAGPTVQLVGMSTLLSKQDDIISTLQTELQRAITGVDLSNVLASTDTPLANGTAWISGWFTVDRYAQVVITALADTAMEVRVEYSWDQSTVHAVEVIDYPKAGGTVGEGDGYVVDVVAPYARIKVTNNSGADQTSLAVRAAGRVI